MHPFNYQGFQRLTSTLHSYRLTRISNGASGFIVGRKDLGDHHTKKDNGKNPSQYQRQKRE
jgi:hypothetical protein